VTTQDHNLSFWPFVILMAMVFSLSPLAIDMYLPALPNMAHYFNSHIDAMEASVAVYLIFFALGQLVLGALADFINKVKLLIMGLVIFSLASLMIGLSANVGELYFWRALQAFSGGSSVVVFALIHTFYDDKQSNQIISYVMACVVIAPMIAPMLGGQILVHAGWQWIFYALAFFALLTLVAQGKLLPIHAVAQDRRDPEQAFRLSTLLRGYKNVLSNTRIMAYIFAGGSAFAGMFAFVSGSPFVYIEYYAVSPEQFGWLVALNAIAMMVMNLVNARLLKHIDPSRKLIVAGFLLAIVGVYLFMVAYLDLSLVYVVIGVVAYIGLLGLTAANAISSALSLAGENAGVLSGINGVLQFSLCALSSAMVSISASVDATTMNTTMALCALCTLIFVTIIACNTRSQPAAALS